MLTKPDCQDWEYKSWISTQMDSSHLQEMRVMPLGQTCHELKLGCLVGLQARL